MTLPALAAALAAELSRTRIITPTLTDDAATLTVTLDEAAILAALEETRREAIEEAGEPIAGHLASLAFRMQCRVDSCLERHGTEQAATTSSGVGISYGLALELARTLQRAAETFNPEYAPDSKRPGTPEDTGSDET